MLDGFNTQRNMNFLLLISKELLHCEACLGVYVFILGPFLRSYILQRNYLKFFVIFLWEVVSGRPENTQFMFSVSGEHGHQVIGV